MYDFKTLLLDWKSVSFWVKIPWKSVLFMVKMHWKSVIFMVKMHWKSVLFMVKMHWKSVIFLVFLVGPRAIVLCQDNVQVNDNVTYMPIYMLMFMQHEQTEDVIYKFQPI